MGRLILVPAKPLARAKARLAPVLSAAERRALTLAMLTDVVAAAAEAGVVWVVCSDPEAAGVAEAAGVRVVTDEVPDAGLNSSLAAAARIAHVSGCDCLLVLASAVPCARAADVDAIVGTASVAIAPSRDGTGTNALWRSPPDVIVTSFGRHSRDSHTRLARSAGIEPALVERPGLA